MTNTEELKKQFEDLFQQKSTSTIEIVNFDYVNFLEMTIIKNGINKDKEMQKAILLSFNRWDNRNYKNLPVTLSFTEIVDKSLEK